MTVAPPATTAPASTTTTAAPPTTTTTTTAAPVADPVSVEAAALQRILDGFVAGRTPQYGIVALDLHSGAQASVNAGVVMWSASLYKLYVAEEILRRLAA